MSLVPAKKAQAQAQAKAKAKAKAKVKAQAKAKESKFNPRVNKKKNKSIYPFIIFKPFPPLFNIFPAKAIQNSRLFHLMNFFTSSIKQQEEMLASWSDPPHANAKVLLLINPHHNPFDSFWSPELIQGICWSLQNIRRFRGIFKRFLHRWRSSRLHRTTEEDIVTMEKPVHPVFIVDWQRRTTTPFEASTLMRDITTRLLAHDGFFEEPLPPRNPLTNISLTQSQEISVWNQISYIPLRPSAAFSQLRLNRWNLEQFETEYSLPLKLSAFRQTLKDLNHIDCQDNILNFIQSVHDKESKHYPETTFNYYMKFRLENMFLKKWIQFFKEDHETSLIYYQDLDKILEIKKQIHEKAKGLIGKLRLVKRDTRIIGSSN